MEKRKVAVCISGQIRTAIEAHSSFINFFKNEDIDVFIHTWYDPKIKDHSEIIEKIKTLYQPKSFQIDHSPNYNRLDFAVMLKSFMLSNELKKNYEIENDFRYDVVVKYRFDILFKHHIQFPTNSIQQRTLYYPFGNTGILNSDYDNHGMTDVIFWGDSQTMDIATDVYRYYVYMLKPRVDIISYKNDFISFDCSDAMMSPGQLIYQYAVKHNIFPVIQLAPDGNIMFHTLWRVEVSHLDPINDYHQINDFYMNQYK
jgi:hypothetical protein